jgi:hypothetical protein
VITCPPLPGPRITGAVALIIRVEIKRADFMGDLAVLGNNAILQD